MSIYVVGLGIVSRCACSTEELAELVQGRPVPERSLPLPFSMNIPPARLRRAGRDQKLACAAADQAFRDAGLSGQIGSESLDAHRVGVILSTGYGATEYSSLFADSVVRGDPSACSPSLFACSVPNASVGHVCMLNGCKGFSTVLAGGDPLEYAALLLRNGRTDVILAGSAEAYFPPLFESVMARETAAGCDLSEGAAMAVLSSTRTSDTWCEVGKSAGMNLGTSPLLERMTDLPEAEYRMEDTLRHFGEPELLYTGENGTWFDETERQVIRRVFPHTGLKHPKRLFGETLGASFMMSVVLAAAEIRLGMCRRALVSGMDMIGNYLCVELKADQTDDSQTD